MSESFSAVWQAAQPRPPSSGSRESKKNFAERFSRCLSETLAKDLRVILGDGVATVAEIGRPTGTRGTAGLDVIYGTPLSGLGLGISIKSVTFGDPQHGRFTKNYTRIDQELRSEAIHHHERQPYAVLAALLFLPVEAAQDGKAGKDTPSSFGRAVQRFRPRMGRSHPQGELGRFESMFICLYDAEGPQPRVGFFDAAMAPPKRGVPDMLTWEAMLDALVAAYHVRNTGSTFEWLDNPEQD